MLNKVQCVDSLLERTNDHGESSDGKGSLDSLRRTLAELYASSHCAVLYAGLTADAFFFIDLAFDKLAHSTKGLTSVVLCLGALIGCGER